MSKFVMYPPDALPMKRLYCDNPMSAARRDCTMDCGKDCLRDAGFSLALVRSLDAVLWSYEFLSRAVADYVEIEWMS